MCASLPGSGVALCRHDFVVVETIDFYQDEDAELPPPMTQRDVVILNKAGLEDEEPAAEEDGDAARDGKVRFSPLLGSPPKAEWHLPFEAPISLKDAV